MPSLPIVLFPSRSTLPARVVANTSASDSVGPDEPMPTMSSCPTRSLRVNSWTSLPQVDIVGEGIEGGGVIGLGLGETDSPGDGADAFDVALGRPPSTGDEHEAIRMIVAATRSRCSVDCPRTQNTCAHLPRHPRLPGPPTYAH